MTARTTTTTTTRRSAAKKASPRTPAKEAAPAVKKPADHKPPKAKVDGDYRVAAVRGTEYRVHVAAMDNYEVLEAVSAGNFIVALQRMLTAADHNAVKEMHRDPVSRIIPASDMAEFFRELMESLNPNS